MTAAIVTNLAAAVDTPEVMQQPDHALRRVLRSGRVLIGGGVLLVVLLGCLVTLPMTLNAESLWYFDAQRSDLVRLAPAAKPIAMWWGTDNLGRSILARSLFGGSISLAIGICAAALSVFLGVTVGLLAGYRGGWVDSVLMRVVDILYGLPYILLVILTKIAFEEPLTALLRYAQLANFVVLVFAIGSVSWLTMARVIRGQVLSLRSQPFIEACRAAGLPEWRIFLRHLLPNLIGPITVFDLHGVTFMNSAGLAVLVQALRMTSPRAIELVLVRAPSAVIRPLQHSGLWHRFTLVDSPAGDAAGA
jgi:oligopeptide transport system permease protein